MPIVSVVVPNYNHAKFLEKRLETIFNQTFQDFELIFLDDASTDGSKEVFEAFSDDPRVSAHFNETNSGSPFVQWNKGFLLAQGNFVWLAESDDFSDPRFLETLVRALTDHENAGIAFCQSRYVDENDRILDNYSYGLYKDNNRWDTDFQVCGQNELKKYFSISNVIPNASAVLIRRSVIQSGILAPEDLKLAGDWMFWVKVLLVSDLCYAATPLNYFRIAHETSQRSRSFNDGAEILEGLEVFKFLESKVTLEEVEKQNIIFRRLRHWMYAHRARKFSWKVNREIFDQFLRVRLIGSDLSPFAAKANVLSRTVLYYLVQVPVLKQTLGTLWYWLRGESRAEKNSG